MGSSDNCWPDPALGGAGVPVGIDEVEVEDGVSLKTHEASC